MYVELLLFLHSLLCGLRLNISGAQHMIFLFLFLFFFMEGRAETRFKLKITYFDTMINYYLSQKFKLWKLWI